MKTDRQLKKDVENELDWDPSIPSTAIGVAVKDGVVTLSGHLETYAEKHAAEKALRRISGVKAIALELDVKLSPQHRRSDSEIATAAQQALRWNTMVPHDGVQVSVDNGWVTLSGEVEWDFQRRGVEKAIRPLMGVVGISNDIALKTRPVAVADIQQRLSDAFKRQVDREVNHLDIRVDGGTVTLKGKVNSWHERDAAAGVAWSAPGVRAVVNDLTID